MAITIKLDGIDITQDLEKQYPLPAKAVDGIYPTGNNGNNWWDLLACINAHAELKNNYFQSAVHTMTIKDSANHKYDVKLLIRANYSARNS